MKIETSNREIEFEKVSVEVSILGQKYILKGEGSQEYLKELANFVDSRIKEILKDAPNMPPLKAAILASINISDELFKLKERERALIDYVNKKTELLESIFSDE